MKKDKKKLKIAVVVMSIVAVLGVVAKVICDKMSDDIIVALADATTEEDK